MADERRKHTRVPLQLSATVMVGNKAVSVQTWDISLRGMSCTPDGSFKAGSSCSVQWVLGAGIEFCIEGSIVRCSETEAAVFFASMDEEAFFHLKRLVQYNMEDPDAINAELAKPL
jgi:hypothetical protein